MPVTRGFDGFDRTPWPRNKVHRYLLIFFLSKTSPNKTLNCKNVSTKGVLTRPESSKIVFDRGSAPGPCCGSLRRSPRPPSRLRRGNSLPISHLLPLDAFSVSILGAFGTSTTHARGTPPFIIVTGLIYMNKNCEI